MENPILVGFIILVIWFALVWGFAAFLTDTCGMTTKYAFPSSLIVVSLLTALVVLALYGQTEACWILGGLVFTLICVKLSGGMS